MDDAQPWPAPWFRYEPDGPHRPSTGLNRATLAYEAYCRRDCERWPCPDEQERLKRSQR